MSDFSQSGLITTFQDLSEGGVESGRERPEHPAAPVTLILPCHGADLGRPAFGMLLKEVAAAGFISRVVVSMNGVDRKGFELAQNEIGRLPQRKQMLWNDDPELIALREKLGARDGKIPASGKGFNVWTALGLLFADKEPGVYVTQDADVASFRGAGLARLCHPVAAPDFGYVFSKMYYSRVTDRIYGRVSRLFLAPFLQGLVRVLGHLPLLDFLLSFRYPLAGEQGVRAEFAWSLPVRGDWALEIGLLCACFRQANPREICQVEGGSLYDHKHQALGTAESGLMKMAGDIAETLFSELSEEGVQASGIFFEAVRSSYRRESQEALRRFRNLAVMNGLPFDQAEEARMVEAFAETLANATARFAGGGRRAELPAWSALAREDDGMLGSVRKVTVDF